MPNDADDGRDIAALQVEVRALREETALNRRRFHELSNIVSPLVLGEAMTSRHELELRDMRSNLDRLRGVWWALGVMATVMAATIGAGWTVASHFIGGGHGG